MLWLCFPLSKEFSGVNNIQTIVRTSKYPVFYINFPSIAICNKNLINWKKIIQAEEMFLPKNYSQSTLNNFRRLIGYLSNFRFDDLNNLEGISELNLTEFQNINIFDLVDFFSFECEDILANCLWIYRKEDCCKLFLKERTENGICLVFNSLISEASRQKLNSKNEYYPLKDSKVGLFHGLQLDILLNKNKSNIEFQKQTGVYVMLKGSEEWSHTSRFYTPGNSKFKFIITPEVTDAEPDVKSYDPEERRCLFDVCIITLSFIIGMFYSIKNIFF